MEWIKCGQSCYSTMKKIIALWRKIGLGRKIDDFYGSPAFKKVLIILYFDLMFTEPRRGIIENLHLLNPRF